MEVDDDDGVDLSPLECTAIPIPREHCSSDPVFTQLECGDSTTFALQLMVRFGDGVHSFRVGISSLP